MIKHFQKALLVAVSLFLLQVHIYAESSNIDKREAVFEFLQDAFQAQVSLSEKDRNLNEVKELLAPYFTNEYMELFLKENLVEENGRYFTLGTDFALYYIPFFEFSDKTQIVTRQNQIYVYEFFPGNMEGPVTYENHYEGVLLEKKDGHLKVVQYLPQIPDEIIQLGNKIQEDSIIGKQIEDFGPLLLLNRSISKKPLELFSYLKEFINNKQAEFLVKI
ncbi:DUF3993 domain-containing protein [Bacillus sp. T3]|uniref:DUF3993 domain-containing protein n=1 Tax=Bacillus sp. T3 TaxID=467262 RepID=UPI0029824DCA|nr:DUF3993 domain-containing protein [Bacillus sp. T3]